MVKAVGTTGEAQLSRCAFLPPNNSCVNVVWSQVTFGICIGLSSQALLWKQFTSNATDVDWGFTVSDEAHICMWMLAVGMLALVSVVYALKVKGTFPFQAPPLHFRLGYASMI
jgi:hypothetical protein